jgi:hypothetical protein
VRPHTVQPDDFAAKNWWTPLRSGPVWYYHTERRFDIKPSLHVNPETLDRELVSLVRALHRSGIPTWPSCAGHWWDPDQTRPIYSRLLTDATEIQQQGLWFTHTETGSYYQYRNQDYYVPWRSYEHFHQEVSGGNGQGYLAFSPPVEHSLWRWPEGLGATGPVAVKKLDLYGIPSLVIKVEASTPEEQAQCWGLLSRSV